MNSPRFRICSAYSRPVRPRCLQRCCRCAFDSGARRDVDGPRGRAARAHGCPAMLARATPSNTANASAPRAHLARALSLPTSTGVTTNTFCQSPGSQTMLSSPCAAACCTMISRLTHRPTALHVTPAIAQIAVKGTPRPEMDCSNRTGGKNAGKLIIALW